MLPGRFSYTAAGNRTRISFHLTCNQYPESCLPCLGALLPFLPSTTPLSHPKSKSTACTYKVLGPYLITTPKTTGVKQGYCTACIATSEGLFD